MNDQHAETLKYEATEIERLEAELAGKNIGSDISDEERAVALAIGYDLKETATASGFIMNPDAMVISCLIRAFAKAIVRERHADSISGQHDPKNG